MFSYPVAPPLTYLTWFVSDVVAFQRGHEDQEGGRASKRRHAGDDDDVDAERTMALMADFAVCASRALIAC